MVDNPDPYEKSVRQAITRIAREHPDCVIESNVGGVENLSLIRFKNGWSISVSYTRTSYSDARFLPVSDGDKSPTAELAIFDSNEKWYVPESDSPWLGEKTAVLGWQDANKILQIVDYIAGKERLYGD